MNFSLSRIHANQSISQKYRLKNQRINANRENEVSETIKQSFSSVL
jgi:hypothetical protein